MIRPTPGFTYLSTENVLADYAALLISLRADLNATDCPVIAFGGSYGGTLTTLFRLKYPHVVAGGQVALDVIAQVARARRVPKMVVRVDDGPLRFQNRLLVQGQPVEVRGGQDHPAGGGGRRIAAH